jgi:hypothetical protein
MTKIRPWILAILAVSGAFLVAGIAGSIVTGMLGFWDLPGAGFCAAMAVVLATFYAAPQRSLLITCSVFAAGAAAAWFFLEPSWYPENYGALAYQPTHLPFIVTCSGGLVGLVLVGVLRFRSGLATS